MASAAGAAVIRQHAALTRTTLLPELQLHLVTPASSLWAATADELQVLSARAGVDVTEPFGLFAWPGGQVRVVLVCRVPRCAICTIVVPPTPLCLLFTRM